MRSGEQHLQQVDSVQLERLTPLVKDNGVKTLKVFVFSGIGNKTYTFNGGKDYGTDGIGFQAQLGDLQTSYDLFSNEAEEEVDFLIMGPGVTTGDSNTGDRLLTQPSQIN